MSHGTPWPDTLKARALELLATMTPAAVRRTLEHEHGQAPATATLRRWSIDAGITRETGKSEPPSDVAAAQAARLEDLAASRDDLSAILVRRLSHGAAAALIRRLDRNAGAEDLVDTVAARWRDALALEAQAADFGPDAVKQAAQATKSILAELEAAERLLIPAHNLVGILTRSVGDHLALEGLAAAGIETGELIVELVIPEPVRVPATPETELPEDANR